MLKNRLFSLRSKIPLTDSTNSNSRNWVRDLWNNVNKETWPCQGPAKQALSICVRVMMDKDDCE